MNKTDFHWGRPYGCGLRTRPHEALSLASRGPNMISEYEPFSLAGEIVTRGPAASPKAYSILAGFEKWMVRMPCVRGANVSSRNLDSWPSERYAFWQSLGWCRRSEPSAVCFWTTPGDRRTSSSETGRVVLGLSFFHCKTPCSRPPGI